MGKQPLNQILYGPPGTGKTYNTIFKALDILAPLSNGKWEDTPQGTTSDVHRKNALQKFNQFKDCGRIVFTTFHQSMAYEDFVEGIKPEIVNGSVIYKPEPGVFKTIAEKARSFVCPIKDYYDSIVHDIQNGSSKGINLPQKTGKPVTITETNGVLSFGKKSSTGTIPYDKVEAVINVYPTTDALENIDNISDEFRKIPSPTGNGTLGGDPSALWAVTKEVLKRKEMGYIPFILIIDEINRGNVANIFGELITLIEDDKRLGNAEATTVTLPYSKEEFGVPNNLYIIGTMNTADRSVEALDSALQRRFTREEMMPKPELLKGVQITGVNSVDTNGNTQNAALADFLYTINRRIEVLKDREHQIGHSYLMKFVTTPLKPIPPTELKEVIYKNIIPLLQEYFYGDYEKIQLVMGKDFVDKDNVKTLFPGNITPDDDVNPFRIKDVTNFTDALNNMDLMQCP